MKNILMPIPKPETTPLNTKIQTELKARVQAELSRIQPKLTLRELVEHLFTLWLAEAEKERKKK